MEEDTYLVLSAEVRIDPDRSPVGKLVESMKQFDPIAPGSVMLRQGKPARLLAVVYDTDSEPNWQEAWIARAIEVWTSLASWRRAAALRARLVRTRVKVVLPRAGRLGQLPG